MYLPLVSIIIPVYNGSNYLKEAIDSALSQTYENIEILVVNDGSNDDGLTEKIALSYGDKIKYFYKENGGVSTALNLGIEKMCGEYFSWLSHDDKYTSDKIKCQVDTLIKYGRDPRACVLCATEHIDKNSMSMIKTKPYFKQDRVNWREVLIRMLKRGTFNGCAFLIPKAAFNEVGGFDEQLRFAQDTLMWMKIFLAKFDVLYVNKYCSLSRIHDKQLTQMGRNILFSDTEKIANWFILQMPLLNNSGKEIFYFFAKRNAKNGCKAAYNLCKEYAKRNRLFTIWQKFCLSIVSLYGGVRPFIRKIYYRLFRKVKTK